MAAHDLTAATCRPGVKRHHLQLGVGHYGVFSGTALARAETYPKVRNFILAERLTGPRTVGASELHLELVEHLGLGHRRRPIHSFMCGLLSTRLRT